VLRRFHAEGNRQVRFSRPDRTGEDEILRRGHPLAAREGVNLRRADAVCRGEIKRIERLHLGKSGLAKPLTDHRLVTGGLLGAEDFVEIVFVRPVGVARLAGETFKDAGDAWELERARLRDDEIARQDWGRHARAPVSQPS
jgi:hypothetical protein